MNGYVLLCFGLNIAQVFIKSWPDPVTRWAESWKQLCVYCMDSNSSTSAVVALAPESSIFNRILDSKLYSDVTQAHWILLSFEGVSEEKVVSSPCTFSHRGVWTLHFMLKESTALSLDQKWLIFVFWLRTKYFPLTSLSSSSKSFKKITLIRTGKNTYFHCLHFKERRKHPMTHTSCLECPFFLVKAEEAAP